MSIQTRPSSRTLARIAAGGLFVNAGLHVMKGATGEWFPSPFTRPFGAALSSPAQNLAWGSINAALAGAMLGRPPRSSGEVVPVAIGGVAMVFALRRYFDGREFIDPRTGAILSQ